MFFVYENNPSNLIVAIVEAQDSDSETNAEIFYHLVGGDSGDTFIILPLTGEIVTQPSLDREARDKYDLVVMATNDAAFRSVDSSGERLVKNRKYNSNNLSLAWVRIVVEDTNDNTPAFPQKVFYAGIIHRKYQT